MMKGMSNMGKKTFGSHKLHCLDIHCHITGETPKLVKKRKKKAGKILARYFKTGKVPDTTPQGIELQVTENHGSGGGP